MNYLRGKHDKTMAHLNGKDRSQLNIFPISMDEMVDENNPVRIIDLFVNRFDFSKLGFDHAIPTGEGRPPFAPSDLMKLYLYGYMNRIRSSRKLEKECERNIELIWLMKGLKPRYKTIADFRSKHPVQFKNFFKEFVALLKGWDLIEGNLIAIDGSKFRAVNAKKNNFNEDKINRQLEYIDNRINEFINTLEENDKSENGNRKIDVEKIKKQLLTQQQRKLKYQSMRETLKETGEEQISTTDKDSRSMPINHNRIEVSYNAQTATDAKHCLIVHFENTNVNDKKALANVAIEAKIILHKETIEVLADKGYHNAEQLDACMRNNITTYVAPKEPAHFTPVPTPEYFGDKFKYDKERDAYICPQKQILKTNGSWYNKKYKNYTTKLQQYKTTACKTCSAKEVCTNNPKGRIIERTQYAKAVEENANRVSAQKEKYLLRQQIVEHPFGTIKRPWGFDYLLLKGKQKCEAEFGIIFSVYNLRRAMSILGFPELKKRLKTALFYIIWLWQLIVRSINQNVYRQYHPW